MNDFSPEQQVRDYLKNRLSQPEREKFEQGLRTDPALRAELARQRAEAAAAELLIDADTRALFKKWPAPPDSYRDAPGKPQRKFWGIVPIAIGTGLLLLAAAFFLAKSLGKDAPQPSLVPPEKSAAQPSPPAAPQPKKPDSYRDAPKPQARAQKPHNSLNASRLALAKRHFLEPNLATIRSAAPDSYRDTDTVQSPIQLAKLAYVAGDFRQTLALLAQADEGSSQQAAFLRANTQFHLGQFDAAAAGFEQLVRQNSRQFRYPAEWGLLLCRLAAPEKSGRWAKDFEKQLAELLANPDHPYLEQAAALRRALADH